MNKAIRKILESAAVIRHTLNDKNYREYMRLLYTYGDKKRFTEEKIYALDQEWLVPDTASFLSTYEELFVYNIYKFIAKNDTPIILDFGANIGMSVKYFHELYPMGQIHAYEADPHIYRYLKQNVLGRDMVHLYNKALSNSDAMLTFYSEGADGGRVTADDMSDNRDNVKVEALDAAKVLAGFSHIDMLKIDIEGSERVVIPRIASELYKVDNIFLEYHSEVGEEQCLPQLLKILQDTGFRFKMQSEQIGEMPFMKKNDNPENGFDLQIDVFGWRE